MKQEFLAWHNKAMQFGKEERRIVIGRSLAISATIV